jgi:hypothetical protein
LSFRISYQYKDYEEDGGFHMLAIPSALQSLFEERLRNESIPNNLKGQYKKWLQYYLDFCSKYHFPDSGDTIPISITSGWPVTRILISTTRQGFSH